MPDREKVIKEYEDYVNSYISLTTSHDYEFEMHKAVLAMLKEQGAVEPKTEPSAKGYWYTCGACGWWLFQVCDTVHFDDLKRIRFCASCGKPVKWE